MASQVCTTPLHLQLWLVAGVCGSSGQLVFTKQQARVMCVHGATRDGILQDAAALAGRQKVSMQDQFLFCSPKCMSFSSADASSRPSAKTARTGRNRSRLYHGTEARSAQQASNEP